MRRPSTGWSTRTVQPVDRTARTAPIPTVPTVPAVPAARRPPRTLPLPAVAPAHAPAAPAATRTHPGLTEREERAAELVDRHLDAHLPLVDLVAALTAQTWPRLPVGIPVPPDRANTIVAAYRSALTDQLQTALAPLHEAVLPFRAAAGIPCTNCPAHEPCAFHARQLKDWWDVLHPVVRDVVHDLPARAAHALRSYR